MKKSGSKLTLNRETVRLLDDQNVNGIMGGVVLQPSSGTVWSQQSVCPSMCYSDCYNCGSSGKPAV